MFGHKSNPVRVLVVGLGNPGDKFASTRHNVGRETVEEIAEQHGQGFSKDRLAHSSVAKWEQISAPDAWGPTRGGTSNIEIVAAIPNTFMNESGLAVRALYKTNKIESLDHVIVVHDEMDLAPGIVKFKRGGGTAGHNGLQSILGHIGSGDFLRIRVGIGKPPRANLGANFVLAKLSGHDLQELEDSKANALDLLGQILNLGPSGNFLR